MALGVFMIRTLGAAVALSGIAAIAHAAPAQPLQSHSWINPPSHQREGPQNRIVYYKGNDLYDLCQQDLWGCTVFIQGVIDGQMAAVMGTNRDVAYCIPQGSEPAQVRDVVVAFLTAHPENRHMMAGSLVAAALTQAWPQCQ
jgi:hypothetical protein